MREIREIGFVKNKFREPADPFEIRKHESEIIIVQEYADGLHRIEENKYLQVIYSFHQSEGFKLIGPRYDGEVTGVFSSRSPKRPSSIGITTVKLIARNGNRLRVSGLDALDGTPILDLKPYEPRLDEPSLEELGKEKEISNPRQEIIRLAKSGDLESLLVKAGSLHGHICPGLALGVIAGAYGIKKYGPKNDGMEEFLAIVETNNCFTDGIQYVSGCTFGNNALIYRDYGKTAVTFSRRDGHGIRMIVRPDYKQFQEEHFPEFTKLFQMVVTERNGDEQEKLRFKKAAAETGIALLKIPTENIFKVEEVKAKLPKYAPIYGSVTCKDCRESMMSSRTVLLNGEQLCMTCAKEAYYELSGCGIQNISD